VADGRRQLEQRLHWTDLRDLGVSDHPAARQGHATDLPALSSLALRPHCVRETQASVPCVRNHPRNRQMVDPARFTAQRKRLRARDVRGCNEAGPPRRQWLRRSGLGLTALGLGGFPSLGRADELEPQYQAGVAKGLEWLAKNQNRNGYWEGTGGQYKPAMT